MFIRIFAILLGLVGGIATMYLGFDIQQNVSPELAREVGTVFVYLPQIYLVIGSLMILFPIALLLWEYLWYVNNSEEENGTLE